MIIGQPDCYISVAIKPNFIATAHVVNCQILAMETGFEPSSVHLGLRWTKWYWGLFYSENFDLPLRIISQISLNIHKSKLGIQKFNELCIQLKTCHETQQTANCEQNYRILKEV